MQVFKFLRNSKGFTLIEISVVIAAIGILAGIGVQRYQASLENSRITVVDNTAAEVRRFIQVNAVHNGAFPATLDNASGNATPASPFFSTISYPVTKDWEKRGNLVYRPTNLSSTERLYTYNPQDGSFTLQDTGVGANIGDSISLSAMASNNVKSWLYQNDGKNWFYDSVSQADGAVYNPWSGTPLEYTVNFEQAGTYQLSFDAKNYATHGEPSRTGTWTKPDGYNNFEFNVSIDNGSGQSVMIPASDIEYQTGTVTFSNVAAGTRTVKIVWTNDSYPGGNQDANAMIKNLTVTRTN